MVEPLTITTLVELVNEFSDATRRAAAETAQPYPDAIGGEAPTRSRTELIDAANRLFEIFKAAPDPNTVAQHLDLIIRESSLTVAVAFDGESISRELVAGSQTLTAAAGALTILEVVERRGPSRLGICEASNCADVYIDGSQQGARKYCSNTCNTRMRVGRLRQREQR